MSNFLNLNNRDFWRGAVVAVLAAIVGYLQTTLESGSLPTADQWWAILKLAGSAALSYLLKNLFTNSNGEMFKKEA